MLKVTVADLRFTGYTLFFRKKLDPLLFHHIFALPATNCMKIKKYTGGVACCEYGINMCDSLTILC